MNTREPELSGMSNVTIEFVLFGCLMINVNLRSIMNRFQPPDACYIELMRFRIRPPKNRELPLQLKATWCVTGNKVSIKNTEMHKEFCRRGKFWPHTHECQHT